MSIEAEGWSLQDDLDLAIAMARQADLVTTDYFKSPELQVERKADNTPVTQADREAEAVIRRTLAEARPDDTVYAEELGRQESNGRRWIIDPIDGTKNYVRGVPVWATLIGLEVDHQMVVGVVSAPMLGTIWYAARGMGAYTVRQGEAPQAIHVTKGDRM